MQERNGEDPEAAVFQRVGCQLWDKLAALATCDQHLGLLPFRVERSKGDGGPIQIVGIEVFLTPASVTEAGGRDETAPV